MLHYKKSSVSEVSDIEKTIEIELAESGASNVENEQVQKRGCTYLNEQQSPQYKIVTAKFISSLIIPTMI